MPKTTVMELLGHLERDELAVLAHHLLNSFTVVSGRAATLREHWEQISTDQRERWLAEIETSSAELTDLLAALARGIPRDVVAELVTV